MIRIYTLAIASFAVVVVGAVALDHLTARADWDETAPVTKTLGQDGNATATRLDEVFHVEWSAAAGRQHQEHIAGYVYNDSGVYATNVQLTITELDSSGQNVSNIIRRVPGSVPGFSRAYFDVPVPPSASYRVAVTSFDVVEPAKAK
ncbi:MAG TPA: hypothetical protein VL086_15695 [Candidatus Nitrosotalea sp.]|jgi:hypothetical protein|nr:hypothetical protein [Candidatus Nitrosotalea sp.]